MKFEKGVLVTTDEKELEGIFIGWTIGQLKQKFIKDFEDENFIDYLTFRNVTIVKRGD